MPNAGDLLSVYGLYDEDITLHGYDSIDGAYVGVWCSKSVTFVGSCQIAVREVGDHDRDDGYEFLMP